MTIYKKINSALYQKEDNFNYSQDMLDGWKADYDFSLDGRKENFVLASNPINLGGLYRNRKIAEKFGRKVSKDYGHTSSPYLDEGDAARHALFSALNAQKFGKKYAKAIGDAHERNMGESYESRSMDLKNNMAGYMIGLDNPYASVKTLKKEVQKSLDQGVLKVIKKGFKKKP